MTDILYLILTCQYLKYGASQPTSWQFLSINPDQAFADRPEGIQSQDNLTIMMTLLLPSILVILIQATASSAASSPFPFSANASIAYPTSPVYKLDYVLKSTNLNSFPAFIFYPSNVADVKAAVAYANKANMKVG